MKEVSRESVDRAEINGTTPEKLVVNLLAAIFSAQELARGNVTKPRKDGITQLDATKIRAIQVCFHVIIIKVHVHVQTQASLYPCVYTQPS